MPKLNRKTICINIHNSWYKWVYEEAVRRDTTVTAIIREMIADRIDGPVLERLAGPCPVLDNQLELKGLNNEPTTAEPDSAGRKTPRTNKKRDPLSVPRKGK